MVDDSQDPQPAPVLTNSQMGEKVRVLYSWDPVMGTAGPWLPGTVQANVIDTPVTEPASEVTLS